MQCSNNLKQLGLAIANYESQHHVLPIGDVESNSLEHTALTLLLPFIEQTNVSNTYNFGKRFFDPVNLTAIRTQINVYQCPSDTAAGRLAHNAAPPSYFSRSNVAVCFGSRTMQLSATNTNTDGAFRINIARTVADITDGTSNTIAGSEVLCGLDDDNATDKTWDVRGIWAWPVMGGFCYTHMNTPNSTAGDTLWYSPQDMECVPSEGMPCNQTGGTDYSRLQAAARSHHPGGVNAIFIDGHASFCSDTINSLTWQALSTVAGGETVQGE
jgi:prepilin-type processing-associated H-X9-DG protein